MLILIELQNFEAVELQYQKILQNIHVQIGHLMYISVLENKACKKLIWERNK